MHNIKDIITTFRTFGVNTIAGTSAGNDANKCQCYDGINFKIRNTMINKPGTLSRVISLAILFGFLATSVTTVWSQSCCPATFLSQTQSSGLTKCGFLGFNDVQTYYDTTNVLHIFLKEEIAESASISEYAQSDSPNDWSLGAGGTVASDVVLICATTNVNPKVSTLTGNVDISASGITENIVWHVLIPHFMYYDPDYYYNFYVYYPETGSPLAWVTTGIDTSWGLIVNPPGHINWQLKQHAALPEGFCVITNESDDYVGSMNWASYLPIAWQPSDYNGPTATTANFQTIDPVKPDVVTTMTQVVTNVLSAGTPSDPITWAWGGYSDWWGYVNDTDTITSTLSMPFTDELLASLITGSIAWPAYDTNSPNGGWQSGTNRVRATYSLDVNHYRGTGTALVYRLSVPYAEKDWTYRFHWFEVTRDANTNEITRVQRSCKVTGTGDNTKPTLSGILKVDVPSQPGTTQVESLTFDGMSPPSPQRPPGT